MFLLIISKAWISKFFIVIHEEEILSIHYVIPLSGWDQGLRL